MIEITIPGRGKYALRYLFLDVNGTLAVDGVLIEGVTERLAVLREKLEIVMLTADTHGRQAEIDTALGLTAQRVTPGQERLQKGQAVLDCGAEGVVAIGNGANDAAMLHYAALGIAVIGHEGLSLEALQAADVVVTSILDALDLLISPRRLIATLRQ
ncbi:MAG: HAD family hydrolase [Anaerolineae bacterium]